MIGLLQVIRDRDGIEVSEGGGVEWVLGDWD